VEGLDAQCGSERVVLDNCKLDVSRVDQPWVGYDVLRHQLDHLAIQVVSLLLVGTWSCFKDLAEEGLELERAILLMETTLCTTLDVLELGAGVSGEPVRLMALGAGCSLVLIKCDIKRGQISATCSAFLFRTASSSAEHMTMLGLDESYRPSSKMMAQSYQSSCSTVWTSCCLPVLCNMTLP
jgi:hypothetical protein